jgi:hypothetical protein
MLGFQRRGQGGGELKMVGGGTSILTKDSTGQWRDDFLGDSRIAGINPRISA